MQRGGVLRGRTHGPDSGVERTGSRGERKGFRLGRGGVFRERLGDDRRSRALAEQGADVASAQGEVGGTQAASIRCAQGREQQEEAGEMAVPQTHVLSMLNEMRVELVTRLQLGLFSGGAERKLTCSSADFSQSIQPGLLFQNIFWGFEYP